MRSRVNPARKVLASYQSTT